MKTPKFWYKSKTIYKYILLPLSYIWLLGSFLNKITKKPIRFNVPVICVGNLIAGGGGKTPLTILIATFFKKKGANIHIIKKQYKCSNKKKVLLVDKESNPTVVGEESLLLARVATTWLTKKRSLGIKHAIDKGAELVILDDGYQDYSVYKSYNILVIKESQNFGNNKILPAGPLRESIEKGLEKADHIFYYGNKKDFINKYPLKKTPITTVKINYKNRNFIRKIKNKNTLAFAGIAHPDNFFNSVLKYGFNIIKKIEYPDHHHFSVNEILNIITISKNLNLSIVTTEKDHVKIPKKFKNQIFSLPLDISFDEKEFYKNFMLKLNQ